MQHSERRPSAGIWTVSKRTYVRRLGCTPARTVTRVPRWKNEHGPRRIRTDPSGNGWSVSGVWLRVNNRRTRNVDGRKDNVAGIVTRPDRSGRVGTGGFTRLVYRVPGRDRSENNTWLARQAREIPGANHSLAGTVPYHIQYHVVEIVRES